MSTAEALGHMRATEAGAPEPIPAIASRTPWQLFWERFREDRLALVALGFIVFEVAMALGAPVIVGVLGHPPDAQFPSVLDPAFGTPSHLAEAFDACFSPYTTGSGFSARDLASLVAWGAVGTIVAARRFAREALDEEGGRAGRRLWELTTLKHITARRSS